MISFAMTYLIFKYDKDIQQKQKLDKEILENAKAEEANRKERLKDFEDEQNRKREAFEKAQREKQEAFEKKQKESIAVTQWASALNFSSCIVSNLYYKDPIELTILNSLKLNYDGVIKIELSSRTPLPIYLKFDIKELNINTSRIVSDINSNSNNEFSAKFNQIKSINEYSKDNVDKTDCLFQFYTSRRKTHFEFYLFYKFDDYRKKEVIESLLFFSNHFEHINRIEMTISGTLSDKTHYYMDENSTENFALNLFGRITFNEKPYIEMTTVNYSFPNNDNKEK